MINNLGIGIDIIEVSRFRRKKYEENRDFYKKIFVKSEINYCLKFKNSAERFAGKFAIKEAVIKSIPEKIGPRDIEIVYANRKPRIRLKSSLVKKYDFIVSVSHEKEFAIGIAIAEKIWWKNYFKIK